MRFWGPWKAIAAIAALAGLAILIEPDRADACGGVAYSWRAVVLKAKEPSVPALAQERVLIVHDAHKGREHFIRETVFSASSNPFGFIVPVPSRPELAPVTDGAALFDELERSRKGNDRRSFERDRIASREIARMIRAEGYAEYVRDQTNNREGGTGTRAKSDEGSMGSGARRKADDVVVLEKQRVGSFTAFVLEARDASAFSDWLIDNDLETRKTLERWVDGYIQLGFYFVALRYEPGRHAKNGALVTETLRISFDTPVPYYPYREPDHEPTETLGPRTLDVWVLSHDARVPIALHTSRDAVSDARNGGNWERAWRASVVPSSTWGPLVEERLTFDSNAPALDTLGSTSLRSLLPNGRVVLQMYQDQRSDRSGWGDVLLVPESPLAQPIEATAEQADLARKIAPLLDPKIIVDETRGARR